jgi:phage/plasmid-associated DNA primase
MELIERIPLERLQFLGKMSYATFKQHTSKCKTEKERKEYYEQFKSYCRGAIKTKGITKRIYSYSEKVKEFTGGRLFSGGSLQGLATDFRGFLMNDTTTDIDVKNCHPVILEHLCKENKIDCPNLSYYNQNRSDILARLGDGGKVAVLKAVNSDKINKKNTDEFLKDLDKECKKIQVEICSLKKYEHITKNIPEVKTYNWMGSAINRVLCVVENDILQVIVKNLTIKGIEICTLMFDGCLLYGNHYKNESLLRELEKAILDQLSIPLTLTYKEHSSQIIFDGTITGEEDEEDLNDIDEAKYVMSKYSYWINCKQQLYCFDDKNGLWTTDMSVHRRVIAEYARGKYKGNIHAINSVMTCIALYCIDDSWMNRHWNTSLGKLLFNNGYYDSKEQKFHAKFNPSIMFQSKIHLDFGEFDDEAIQVLKKKLFFDPLGNEVGTYLIQVLARALMGDKMKKIFFGLGGSNCGKSTITTAFSKSCGEYVGVFNASNLCQKESSDEAQAQRWALLLASKRIIFSNELSPTQKLSGTALKKHSGNDEIMGRLHGGNETSFQPHYTMMLFGNDMPSISPYDDAIDNRVDVFNYNKRFVDDPDEDELQRDPRLIEEMDTPEFQFNFIGMLIWAYLEYQTHGSKQKPEECMKAKKDWIDQEIGALPSFLQEFEITNKVEDKVPSSEIQEWLQDKKLGITMKKLGMELKPYLIKHNFDKVENKVVSMNGKKIQAWLGIKRF